RQPVGAGENRVPCDPRLRSLAGLTPRDADGWQSGCPAGPAGPFGGEGGEACRPISLVHVQEEPWAGAAHKIAAIARDRGLTVVVSGVKASDVQRGSLGSWDVLLSVA